MLTQKEKNAWQSRGHLAGEQRRSAGAALLLKHFTQFLRLEAFSPLTQYNTKLFASDDGIFRWLQSATIQVISQTEVELKALLKELYIAGADLPTA